MSTATDTPDQRLAEYRALFERALVRRRRLEHSVVFALRGGARPHVEDLARREAACCPFLDHRVESTHDEVIWTVSNGTNRADAEITLDAFYAVPGRWAE